MLRENIWKLDEPEPVELGLLTCLVVELLFRGQWCINWRVPQVVGMDTSYTGGLTVGVTACDPSLLTQNELPDDSDNLLDRPEYWVVHKDVVTTAEVGDELSFTMSNDG